MKQKDITLTPLNIINQLGEFDLDPCGFKGHKTAKTIYYIPDKNGLKEIWFGRVWLNPPYSETIKWIKKLVIHNNGIACVLASTETKWFQEYVLKKAMSILFLRGRPKFLNSNFEPINLMRGVVLIGYGKCDKMLKESKLPGVYLKIT